MQVRYLCLTSRHDSAEEKDIPSPLFRPNMGMQRRKLFKGTECVI